MHYLFIDMPIATSEIVRRPVGMHIGRSHRIYGASPCDPRRMEGCSMIGMVLVTHGQLAKEFIATLEHIVGPQSQIAMVCIGPEDDVEQRHKHILDSVLAVDSGEGVVLLTDMFGGTPSNLAMSVMDRTNIDVIAGINLPMLIKIARLRQTQPLAELVHCAQEAGRKNIYVASQLLATGPG